MRYNYFEAKRIAEEKQNEYDVFYENAGKPELDNKWFDSLPAYMHNVNLVQRHPMMLVNDTGNGKPWEYPLTIMAWGMPIPEEAYLTEEELNEPVWFIRSYNDDYNW
jgi:hypothetical protein